MHTPSSDQSPELGRSSPLILAMADAMGMANAQLGPTLVVVPVQEQSAVFGPLRVAQLDCDGSCACRIGAGLSQGCVVPALTRTGSRTKVAWHVCKL